MFQFFQNQDARALADDEAVAAGIPGTRRAMRLVVALDSARMAAKPPILIGVTAASAPPQIMTSASSRWMMRKESPMLWALLVQAVAVAEFGPLAPVRIETQPEARLTIVAGMKNGEMRPGPPSSSFLCSRSITSNPPMPLPM